MKTKSIFLPLLLLAVSFVSTGCPGTKPPEKYEEFHKNYIQRYCDLNELSAVQYALLISGAETPSYGFSLMAHGERIASYEGEAFDGIAERNGDINYNQIEWVLSPGTAEGPRALA